MKPDKADLSFTLSRYARYCKEKSFTDPEGAQPQVSWYFLQQQGPSLNLAAFMLILLSSQINTTKDSEAELMYFTNNKIIQISYCWPLCDAAAHC